MREITGVRMAAIALSRAIQLLGILFTFFEAPIFLLRNRRLFNNPIVYVFWTWSLGHTILGLDYASRLYYPHQISLIYIPDPRSNPYLTLCFEHNMDVFVYQSAFCRLLERIERRISLFGLRKAQYRLMRLLVMITSAMTDRFQVIERDTIVYKALSVAEDRLRIGREDTGELVRQGDHTGYLRLLRENVGQPPRMPEELARRCRGAIGARHPEFFAKPFVTLLLRRKGEGSREFHDALRCAGLHENYVPAVEYLTEKGYHVVGTGETDHAVFAPIRGYYALDSIDLPAKLLNLFVLMHCELFIGQASGPNWMGSAAGHQTLVCEGVLYSGTFRAADVLLHKPLYERETGRRLSLVELFRDHKDLVLGCNYAKKGIVVGHNSSEEILEAVKESVAIIRGELVLTEEDRLLCQKFAELVPHEALVRYQRNRPTLYVLREHHKELLGER